MLVICENVKSEYTFLQGATLQNC